jgi:hypothetical protein
MTSAIDVVYIIVIVSLIIIPFIASIAHSWFGLNDPTSPSSNVKDLSTLEINQKCRIVIERWANPAQASHLAKLEEKENEGKQRRATKPRGSVVATNATATANKEEEFDFGVLFIFYWIKFIAKTIVQKMKKWLLL